VKSKCGWALQMYIGHKQGKSFLPDVNSTFDQYKNYTIGKYHHVNIKCTHYLSLDQILMISLSTRKIIKIKKH